MDNRKPLFLLSINKHTVISCMIMFIPRMPDSFAYDHYCSNQFSGSSGDENALFKQTLPWFYQLLTWTSWGQSVATTGKSALKLLSQSLRVIGLERVKLGLCKVTKTVCIVGGKFCFPHHTNHRQPKLRMGVWPLKCVVSDCVILKIAVNIKDLYGNSGNRFNNMLAVSIYLFKSHKNLLYS